MKKKLLVLILVVVMTASVFSGCTLFVKNSERDLAQVVARVGAGDRIDEITKEDLVTSYTTFGYQYESYFSSAEELVEYLMDYNVNRTIVLHAAMDQMEKVGTPSTEDTRHARYDAYLTADELAKITKQVEKSISELLDTYEEKIYEEWYEDGESDEESDEDDFIFPSLRQTPSSDEEDVIGTYATINPDEMSNERYAAYKRMIRVIEQREETYEEFYDSLVKTAKENKMITKYQDFIKDQVVVSEAEAQARFENLVIQQQEEFAIDPSQYATALDSVSDSEFVLYNATSGYGYVMNLLIGFNDYQSSLLSSYQAMDWSNETYVAKRAELLNGLKVQDQRDSWLYHYGYDTEESKKLFDSIAFRGTVTPKLNGLGKHEKNSDGMYLYDELTAEEIPFADFIVELDKALEGAVASTVDGFEIKTASAKNAKDVFNDYIFAFGTDPGALQSYIGYVSAPEVGITENETYVIEFAEAARAVVASGVGSYTVVATDFGYHIIYCTKKIVKGVETVYNHAERETEGTFSYDFYHAITADMQADYYTEQESSILESYTEREGYVVTYPNVYKQLLG